ncbi:uncharacterized protein (DUF305 family) [Nocardioides aromaticivorans]|uniref:Uncharacterized protein (DUF305 family) n=1 Tax=Nocardioides aromaticivorans TaxID=200618 RepID=A0A7Y9ZI01_9ACTN|nr:DUF305 domain-containing protein [Nocardioides aromaticivorans]NYI44748.1 uncharacterized protein (DUF305 family) [Nocardioides aromaticivorans]
MNDSTLRRTAAAITATALALALTACGSDDGGHDGHGSDASAVQTARNGDEFNQADVDFATAMIPHHAQAVQMANLAADRPLPDELRTLVDGVHTTQVAEVETMVTWLTDWGEEIPETSMDHVNGGHGDDMDDMSDMDHGDEMPGMMSAEEMTELAQASDADFPELWMRMMVEHHEGAIEMAETEQDDGHFPDAVDLAGAIIEAQRAEIATMQDLLAD